ncbi:MAG: carbon monoxide dehydrogenase subunit G [Gammaproteobacteria bacterium]|nr:carbon monoxide dehydrogenase subunit G [Gammaproteobacteria bacterium]MDE0157119.1 carbon monoxide dehydrogenase subunit G [Gammaproteobacteria bacterium]MDE0285547.1 carbon monoxide dehydrogenase subunit G [Gammaproteobacteria bacterium]MDE0514436.1 carbon monoxide dehydrogenase subunit G [Gammaproteobacteria bacterium]
MIIEGEYQLPCKIGEAWQALNDPQTLQRCIAGCESIEQTGEDSFECLITAKYGPVKARFKSVLNLTNINAPHSYTLSGEGKGGAAGFGKGKADVRLTQEGEMTTLRYQAEFTVGGKLAQVGSRLVASTTRKLANDFFTRFSEELSGE